MNYPEQDNLVPLTVLAKTLGFTPKKESFDEERYIPIKLLEAELLYTDPEFQRLLNKGMIKQAKKFDPDLVRPLYVFKRPNGKYSVADGQHETCIGILYTVESGKVKLPCQVREHDPSATLAQCLEVEANFFKKLNFNRRNVGKVDKLRAEIAMKDESALAIEEKLQDMKVSIEGIGDPNGVPVYGYTKLMDAHKKYNLSSVKSAIDLYVKHQNDAEAPKWNDIDKPLNGGLIGGIAALYFLLAELGEGEKHHALNYYLNNNLRKDNPTGKNSLMTDIGGDLQSVLIARRVVSRCNTLIEQGYITKKNGESLQVTIGEDIMKKAGLGDPSAS